MLTTGILNPDIRSLLARVRHTNTLVISDRGFPFWPMIETVDISLMDDIPTVLQVLQAIRPDYVIGRAFMASQFLDANTYNTLIGMHGWMALFAIFIGIGGIGMSAIAATYRHLGYSVSGSDISDNAQTQALRMQGIHVNIGHTSSNIPAHAVVIYSNAIPADNSERQQAKKIGCPTISRAVALATLSNRFRTVAVAGTHGKTTTASLITHILHENGHDPTFLIGGLPMDIGRNAALGKSD